MVKEGMNLTCENLPDLLNIEAYRASQFHF
jgi:hypothetical protein